MPEAEATKPRAGQQAPAGAASWLDRRLDLTRVDPQIWIFLALLVAAALLRFWDLGSRAMHHDEAVHAWYSWRSYTGEELYQYNPTYHGPFLYLTTALFYFLFGVSDAIARAPEAIFGLLLVALCYPLRRWLGRWGWLIAAALLTFSPAFSYFARFARHDAFVVTLTLGMAIALFLYLEERRPRDLVLAAACLALSFASHELTFITFFIFLSFLGLSYLLDRQRGGFQREAQIIAATLLVLGILGEIALGLAGQGSSPAQMVLVILILLAAGYLGLSFLWPRLYPGAASPVQEAGQALGRDLRPLLMALGVFGVIFGLLFTGFLTYPRGFLDGLIQGLTYWAGQQPVSRGDQPWFYYLMLLPLYEPIALLGGLAGLGVVLNQALRQTVRRKARPEEEEARPAPPPPTLFAVFLVYWAVFALVLYSWAGEKMPWLLLHVALPLVLLASLALDRFVAWMVSSGRLFWRSWDWAIGPLFLLLAFALRGLAALATGQVPHPLAAQYLQLQIAVLVLVTLGLIAALAWRIYHIAGRHLGQSFAALGLLLLALYTVRSTFLVNFYNGDTPVEMLVYTQTAPDVPLVVRQIERLSIDQTRKDRTAADPTGGHGLKIAIDSSRNAALEWPFNWYLRDFSSAGNLSDFDGTQGPPPDSDILLVLAANEQTMRPYLQGKYTGMLLKHRWWFPEFETYKRWTLLREEVTKQGYITMPWLRPSTYSQAGVINLWNYILYRQLPRALDSQDFYLYVRSELMPAGGPAAQPDPYIEKMVPRTATQSMGSGLLSYPRAIALDAAGNLYVADSGNHRIVRFGPQGESSFWGGYCLLDPSNPCLGQFNEPWGVAVDAQGRVYVADTWNHRIQVFDAAGKFLGQWGEGILVDADLDSRQRAGTPFGFYGPRGVAVDSQGRVYVTDTGNERVLVYTVSVDAAGQVQAEFLYQWGTMGPEPGQFLEPVGVAVDAAGRVYVADTLNGRIQVFAPGSNGQVSLLPAVTWKVTGWDSVSRENKPFLAVSPGGQVYFTVPERNYVAGTDGAGNVLTVWGGLGSDLSTFTMPVGVAVDAKGSVYVSDSGNGRVLVFTVP